MAKIYLIRHCESEGNACRRAQAQTDALVTRRGYEQNEMLRRRFDGIPIDALYSSDAFRSIMTLTPISRERHLPIKIRISLREITTGIWEDCAWGNIAKDYPSEYKVWTETPWITTAPGATTFQQAADRVIFCLRRIASEIGDGTALVVSHSCSIKASLCVMMNKSLTEVAKVGHGENTSVSLLEIDPDGTIHVAYTNDDSHLPQRLHRTWNGVAGSDINMVTEPWIPEQQTDILLSLAKAEHQERGAFFDRNAYLACARQKSAQCPGSIAITYLKNEPVGFVRWGENAELPDDTGVLERYYVIPRLQGRGYGEQLLGYAAHEMRYAGKRTIAVRQECSTEERRSLGRFPFHEMNGHPEYAELELFTPPCPYPILA
ncbi:GNAT family N-acetyltransferase [Clostridium vitabionis]|uniref:GNAT family N-acetyltransferase n=1 Tax=Clostridium vitabionis TaxID=2784388 RepID=UPI00188A990D|nr:GNAT family N-acetyltransferase [Clostridium vitabionis]